MSNEHTNPYDEEVESDSPFLKLSPGDKLKIRLMTQPSKVKKIFDDDKEAEGYKTRTVWVWGVLVIKTNDKQGTVYIPKVYEGGAQIFGQIKELVQNEDWGDPTKYDIWIKRDGAGLDTKYRIAPGQRYPIDAKMQEAWEGFTFNPPQHGSTMDYRKSSQSSVSAKPSNTEEDPFE